MTNIVNQELVYMQLLNTQKLQERQEKGKISHLEQPGEVMWEALYW